MEADAAVGFASSLLETEDGGAADGAAAINALKSFDVLEGTVGTAAIGTAAAAESRWSGVAEEALMVPLCCFDTLSAASDGSFSCVSDFVDLTEGVPVFTEERDWGPSSFVELSIACNRGGREALLLLVAPCDVAATISGVISEHCVITGFVAGGLVCVAVAVVRFACAKGVGGGGAATAGVATDVEAALDLPCFGLLRKLP